MIVFVQCQTWKKTSKLANSRLCPVSDLKETPKWLSLYSVRPGRRPPRRLRLPLHQEEQQCPDRLPGWSLIKVQTMLAAEYYLLWTYNRHFETSPQMLGQLFIYIGCAWIHRINKLKAAWLACTFPFIPVYWKRKGPMYCILTLKIQHWSVPLRFMNKFSYHTLLRDLMCT